jgi:hypothetical protein
MHKAKNKNIRTSIQRKIEQNAGKDTEITPLEEHE